MLDDLTTIPIENRWRGQTHPAPIVVSIIRRGKADGPCLLIKRNSQPYSGQWALVGGKWDFGETLEEAAVREVKEETGLDVKFVALRGLVNERLEPDPKQINKAAHFLIFICLVDAGDGTAHEQNEGIVRWFSPSEIEALHQVGSIIPSDYAMLSRFSNSDSLPYYEVSMKTVQENDRKTAKLERFERIS